MNATIEFSARRDCLLDRAVAIYAADPRFRAGWLESSLADASAYAYSDVDLEVQIPSRFFQVRYNGAAHPLANVVGLSQGANCQRFVFELLKHFGYEIGPMRSSELWEDHTFTRRVRRMQPLDILMFNRNADAWGAHVALYLGGGRAIHLSKAVGKPVIWKLREFLKVDGCRLLVGIKRPVRRA